MTSLSPRRLGPRRLLIAGGAAVTALAAARALRAKKRDTEASAQQPTPTSKKFSSSLARNAGLARVGATGGAHMAVARVRSIGADEERTAELRAGAELRTAEAVAETLGNMKGALMKLGQMASYLEAGLPEPMREALVQLQADAPPMAPELAAEVIAAELGAPPEQVFASWEPRPIAAASIGQVHRATTKDGTQVAVKVQYPGVDDAIRHDLQTSNVVFSALGMMFPGMDPKPIVAELRERLGEELDYVNEAANQRRFADYFEGHPAIHVPRVLEEYSTARVLTSEYVVGDRWPALLEASQEERNLAGEAIFRYVFSSIYGLGTFNGDPHPGNYLVQGPGRLSFLDYGLVKHFDTETVADFESLIVAMVLQRDPDKFRAEVERIGLLPAGAPFSTEDVVGYFGHFYDHIMEDREVTIEPEWSEEAVRRYFDLSGPYASIMKMANLPGDWVIVQRINLGLYALLGELRATANWRRISEELWPSVLGPPSTPMGEAIAAWEVASGKTRGPKATSPDLGLPEPGRPEAGRPGPSHPGVSRRGQSAG
jgi:predicted unusual protein kinase regulating ubiquinone biosynthesis (AarF/ABC1/UbiB family)